MAVAELAPSPRTTAPSPPARHRSRNRTGRSGVPAGAERRRQNTAVRILLGLMSPSRTGRGVRPSPASRYAACAAEPSCRWPACPRRCASANISNCFPATTRSPCDRGTLAAAGLGEIRNRFFANSPAARKQRVLFALAICGNPGLLCLDEPTAGLDVEARRGLWARIAASPGGAAACCSPLTTWRKPMR